MKPLPWLTPPELYAKLDAEFHFDFDPCPCPRPDGYNSLVVPWGRSNYVNPPFNKKDSPFGGPADFVRKALAEQQLGNTSVFVLPLSWSVGLLMRANAELRYAGFIRWLDVHTKVPYKRQTHHVIQILRGAGVVTEIGPWKQLAP